MTTAPELEPHYTISYRLYAAILCTVQHIILYQP